MNNLPKPEIRYKDGAIFLKPIKGNGDLHYLIWMESASALIFPEQRIEVNTASGEEIEVRLSSLEVRKYRGEPIGIKADSYICTVQARNGSFLIGSDKAQIKFILTDADIAAIMAEKRGEKPPAETPKQIEAPRVGVASVPAPAPTAPVQGPAVGAVITVNVGNNPPGNSPPQMTPHDQARIEELLKKVEVSLSKFEIIGNQREQIERALETIEAMSKRNEILIQQGQILGQLTVLMREIQRRLNRNDATLGKKITAIFAKLKLAPQQPQDAALAKSIADAAELSVKMAVEKIERMNEAFQSKLAGMIKSALEELAQPAKNQTDTVNRALIARTLAQVSEMQMTLEKVLTMVKKSTENRYRSGLWRMAVVFMWKKLWNTRWRLNKVWRHSQATRKAFNASHAALASSFGNLAGEIAAHQKENERIFQAHASDLCGHGDILHKHGQVLQRILTEVRKRPEPAVVDPKKSETRWFMALFIRTIRMIVRTKRTERAKPESVTRNSGTSYGMIIMAVSAILVIVACGKWLTASKPSKGGQPTYTTINNTPTALPPEIAALKAPNSGVVYQHQQ